MSRFSQIGNSAFQDCKSLTEIYWNAVSVNDFTNDSKQFYYAGFNAKEMRVVFGDQVERIPTYAFINCNKMKSVMISSSVASVGTYAFSNCNNIESVYIDDLANWCNIVFENSSSNPLSSDTSLFLNGELVTNAIIPFGITKIGDYAFYGYGCLASVTIPDSVVEIGKEAFYENSGLKQISIGYNVNTIEKSAFRYCSNVESIIVQKGNEKYCGAGNCLIEIATKTIIMGCKNSQIPNDGSVTTIGSYSFLGSNLIEITIPESITAINSGAFNYCTLLSKINWNAVSVNDFGYDDVFYNTGMSGNGIEIIFGDSVKKIPALAFDMDIYTTPPKIKSVSIPDTITSIGEYAFLNCNCEILLQITSIENWINNTCWINSVFPATCTRKIYINGEHLTEIVIPNTVTRIGNAAFAGCATLTKIIYDGEYNEWRHIIKASSWDDGCGEYEFVCKENNGLLYDANDEISEFYVSGYRSENGIVTIPETYSGRPATKIYGGTFKDNLFLTDVTINDGIQFIGKSAFAGCENLASIAVPFVGQNATTDATDYFGYIFGADSHIYNTSVVPKSLKIVTLSGEAKISAYAFYGCNGIELVNLPENIEQIGDYAFSGCNNFTSFEIPDTVERVGVMILDGCNNIKTIHIGTSLETVDDHDGYIEVEGKKIKIENPLFGISKQNSALSTYTVSGNNKVFATDSYGVLYRKMTIPYSGGNTEIKVAVVDAPANANLSNYIFPDHIVEIEPYAFANHRTLYSVDLEYIRMIGKNAFYGCSELNTATFGKPERIDSEFNSFVATIAYSQYIGDGAFMGCNALQKVNIDTDMLVGIGERAFYDCSKLKTVIIGDNIQVIGLQAFGVSNSGYSSLERFEVKEDNSYFKSISGVLYAVLENGNLKLIHYPANLPELDISVKNGIVTNQTVRYENNAPIYVEEFTLPMVCDDGVTTANVVALDSYAFQTAEHLKNVMLYPVSELTVGDYAFSGSSIESIEIGKNINSLGLRRGEGEYTVFADCDYLKEIIVDSGNSYYNSANGVLFDKKQTKLFKYPAAKGGNHYTVPATVSTIGSMAFKGNLNLLTVEIPSYISAIGLEAFYRCSKLAVVFFNGVYAPKVVMENAFTTYYQPATLIGYTDSFYSDGKGINDYGWGNYNKAYTLQAMNSIPEINVSDSNDYYAVVVVDADGNRVNSVEKDGVFTPFIVSLTDPYGKTETVKTGKDENGIGDGVAVFYNLYGNVNLGFAIDYDAPYQLRVTDPTGTYFPFVSKDFYLDYETRITFVTLSKAPDVFGLNCGEHDINTETYTLNKAEYGSKIILKDSTKGYDESNRIRIPETVEISVIAYPNDSDMVVNSESEYTGLFQNGNQIPGVKIAKDTNGFDKIIYDDCSVTVYFEVPVESLIAEVPIECRVGFQKDGRNAISPSSFLNIDVIDFTLTEDDINLDSTELSVDLTQSGEIITKLLGSNNWNFYLGKNLAMGVDVDGDKVTLSLNAAYAASKEKKSSAKDYGDDYQAGYYANIIGSTGQTWEFDRYGTIFDENGEMHTYKMIIRVAHATKDLGYCYYRCYIWEGEYANQQALWYGVIKAPNMGNMSASRSAYSLKADMIFLTYFAEANAQQDITKGFKYIEPVTTDFTSGIVKDYTTKNSFDATLYGDITFQYEKGKGLVPVNSYIKGEIKYAFEHEQQFVVWVIPVYLQVKVDIDGKVELKLDYDKGRSITIDEAKMTLKAEISAKAGVGCKIISAGVNGSIGTVFILDFAPQFGVEKWTVSGKLSLYATYYTLKWKQTNWWPYVWYPVTAQTTSEATLFDKTWTIIDNTTGEVVSDQKKVAKLQSAMLASMFMTDYYEPADPSECDEQATLFTVGDELYKVYYANMMNKVSDENSNEYDSYNFKKLAVAKWNSNSSKWKLQYIIDDNGFNDLEYELYSFGDKVSLVFTQQTERTNAHEKSDEPKEQTENESDYVSDYVSELVVKYVDLSDINNLSDVHAVADDAYYKYFVSTANVNGKQVVVWAENTDNNIFGVSSYNYVDSNGDVHIYSTVSNSIWISTQNVDKTWTDPVCIADGLAPITDLIVSDDGYVYYIVDLNCDLSDINDREMYGISIDSRKIVNINNGANISGLQRSGDGILYTLESNDNTEIVYLNQKAISKTHSLPKDVLSYADDYKVIYDSQNQPIAVLYSNNKTWKNNKGETVSGSTLYGVFRNGENWGNPVEIQTNEIKPTADRYISSFDVLLKPGTIDTLLLNVEYITNKTKDSEVYSEYTQITDQYMLQSLIEVDDVQIDYTNSKMTVSVHNAGASSAKALVKVDNGSSITVCDSLVSGESANFTVDLLGHGLNPTVRIYADSTDKDPVDTIETDLNYSDLQPIVKQLLLGKNNTLLIAVRNNGNITGSGKLYVDVGSNTAESIVKKAAVGVIDTLKPGGIRYYYVQLSGFELEDNTIFTVYIESEQTEYSEKGNCNENNILYTTLQKFDSDVNEDGSSYKPEISSHLVIFDPQKPEDIELTYSCSETDSMLSIVLNGVILQPSDYTVDSESNTVTIHKEYLKTVDGGEHVLIFSFISGNTDTVSLKVKTYHTVTWRNYDGTLLGESTVEDGTVPQCDIIPTRESTISTEYTFVGWHNPRNDSNSIHITTDDIISMNVEGRSAIISLHSCDIDIGDSFIITADGLSQTYKATDIKADHGNITITGTLLVDCISSATQNEEYIAAFEVKTKEFNVTWEMQGNDGKPVSSTETYKFGEVPKYQGKDITPEGLLFDKWDKECMPVSEDCLYQAIYIDPSILQYLLGDVNNDGEIDIFDILLMIDYLNGDAQLDGNNVKAGLIVNDKDMDIFDVLALLDYINGDALLPEKKGW